jgi:uncharacterized protein (DUF488 family)
VIRLFTLGYQQRSLEEFVRLLLHAEIDVLLDVRETAWSHKPGFSKRRLAETLEANGILYVHARFAGNPKQLRTGAASPTECLQLFDRHLQANPVILEAFDELVGRFLDAGRRVCLMCYERHPGDCHRGVLAERWRSGFWREVEHLGTEVSYPGRAFSPGTSVPPGRRARGVKAG